jgi:hypothetical protein
MYNKPCINKQTLSSDLLDFQKLVRSVLSPLLVSLGWVEVKEGYEYRCSGGTFLLYIGNCKPQTWHCDSNDPLSLSLIIPLTEECRMPEFAAPEHQIRGLISEFCQKFDLPEFPEIEQTLATEAQITWWREHILVASFRGQNYKVHVKSHENLRPGDIVLFHPWVVHRGAFHKVGEHPKGCLFVQLQYTDQKMGIFSGDKQIYLGPSTVGMSEMSEEIFKEVVTCINNMGEPTALLHNMNWYGDSINMKEDEVILMREYINYLNKFHSDRLAYYCPKHNNFLTRYDSGSSSSSGSRGKKRKAIK